MSQHDQEQYQSADGTGADGRVKKPRHKKFQTQSYGERMAAAAAAEPQARGDVRDDTVRGDRRGGPSQYSDRGSRDGKSYDRRDNGYDRRGDRPVKGYRAERANSSGDRGYQRDDRGYQRTDRPAYQRDDRGSNGRDDRRSFNRDDRGGYQRDDRRSFNRDDRPGYQRDDRRSFNRDDRGGYQRSDRPAYQRDDRGSNGRDDRKTYNRDDRRSFGRDDRPGYQRDDRRSFNRDDRRDERPAPVRDEQPVDLGEVAEGNKFAELGLAPRLVQRLARDGITSPFPIQAATIPDALAGKDVLGRGQTGSGKTLGFGLPTLMRLAGGRTESRRPRGVVLVPTRELAMQVHDALEPLAHVMNVSIKLIAGGLPYPKQIDALRRGVDLLIATPGRLIDLCEQGAADLGAVEVAVLDEADHMCDMGFMPAVTTLLDMTPAEGQRLLFSATLDNDVDTIVKTYLKDPVVHSTDAAQAAVTTMEHHLLVIEPGHKQSLTAELASRDGRTIVFVRTKLGADRVATQLRDRGVMAAALHGGLTQGARNRTLDQFKDGLVPVLVATDVAARGIHVDDVGLVVQADPAADHKDYLHRAGRTARAGGKGAVVTLVLPHQRRGMIRLAESAGVEASPVRARPGDHLVTELTGGSKPSGTPVTLPPAPKPKSFGKGGKRFGSGRPGGRSFEGRGGDRRRSDRGGYGQRRDNNRSDGGSRSYQR
ncbi:superfamily II DNA/RNA helicase [Kribbella amoyensis]|uniref:Superfamily II DNA/RNA helicase n=1 Tax=Kribbella amoyensis TaxID=996641 RepID=A0A561BRV1_9ACTN|nr:DEAD/DEAH box helicase [Kribbella amoyensis]TWD81627.1 superfamily II DNA/RNA helicase [Kribbella amoyensis]